MSPTLSPNSFVIIDKYNKTYHNGDIIVFYSPSLDATCIKRVLASPNESIHIKNGLIYVNDTESPLQITSSPINYSGIASDLLIIPDQHFFVIGDNYDQSLDSRYPEVGLIFSENIIGKVVFPILQ